MLQQTVKATLIMLKNSIILYSHILADWLSKFIKAPETKLASPVTEVWSSVPHPQGVTQDDYF